MNGNEEEYKICKKITQVGELEVEVLIIYFGETKAILKRYPPLATDRIKEPTERSKIIKATEILIRNEKSILHYLCQKTKVVVRTLSHPDDNKPYLLLEYLSKGTLLEFIMKLIDPSKGYTQQVPEDLSRGIFVKLLDAVNHIHLCNVIHLDLKPENIMFSDKSELKLIDFGHSIYAKAKEENYGIRVPPANIGTKQYRAPEIEKSLWEKTPFLGKPADVFSLGVILFVFHFKIFPFANANAADPRYGLIIKEEYEKFWEDIERVTPIHASEDLKTLIVGMLLNRPEERLTIGEIMNHSWVREMTLDRYTQITREIERLLALFYP
jgi:serine/threonine protein kinase